MDSAVKTAIIVIAIGVVALLSIAIWSEYGLNVSGVVEARVEADLLDDYAGDVNESLNSVKIAFGDISKSSHGAFMGFPEDKQRLINALESIKHEYRRMSSIQPPPRMTYTHKQIVDALEVCASGAQHRLNAYEHLSQLETDKAEKEFDISNDVFDECQTEFDQAVDTWMY